MQHAITDLPVAVRFRHPDVSTSGQRDAVTRAPVALTHCGVWFGRRTPRLYTLTGTIVAAAAFADVCDNRGHGGDKGMTGRHTRAMHPDCDRRHLNRVGIPRIYVPGD
jgi:hypothetical protein